MVGAMVGAMVFPNYLPGTSNSWVPKIGRWLGKTRESPMWFGIGPLARGNSVLAVPEVGVRISVTIILSVAPVFKKRPATAKNGNRHRRKRL